MKSFPPTELCENPIRSVIRNTQTSLSFWTGFMNSTAPTRLAECVITWTAIVLTSNMLTCVYAQDHNVKCATLFLICSLWICDICTTGIISERIDKDRCLLRFTVHVFIKLISKTKNLSVWYKLLADIPSLPAVQGISCILTVAPRCLQIRSNIGQEMSLGMDGDWNVCIGGMLPLRLLNLWKNSEWEQL